VRHIKTEHILRFFSEQDAGEHLRA